MECFSGRERKGVWDVADGPTTQSSFTGFARMKGEVNGEVKRNFGEERCWIHGNER